MNDEILKQLCRISVYSFLIACSLYAFGGCKVEKPITEAKEAQTSSTTGLESSSSGSIKLECVSSSTTSEEK